MILLLTGKSGKVTFDDNGDRIADYYIWHLQQRGIEYTTWTEILMTNKDLQNVNTNILENICVLLWV